METTAIQEMTSSIPMLQCRLAKDGSDADIEKEFLHVANRSDRIKTLIRLGLQHEKLQLLKNTRPYNLTGQDAALRRPTIVAKIGSETIKVDLS